MSEYAYARCLFCSTGKEENVVAAIQENGWGRAIFPQRVKSFRQEKSWVEKNVPLLPGYVFLYSDQKELPRDEILGIRHVIRLLTYEGCKQDVLIGRDREFADWLWSMNGQIGAMKALQIGDRVEIIDGAFKRLQATIIRMDRRRRTIQVNLNSSGALRNIWLSYDIVEKREDVGQRMEALP